MYVNSAGYFYGCKLELLMFAVIWKSVKFKRYEISKALFDL